MCYACYIKFKRHLKKGNDHAIDIVVDDDDNYDERLPLCDRPSNTELIPRVTTTSTHDGSIRGPCSSLFYDGTTQVKTTSTNVQTMSSCEPASSLHSTSRAAGIPVKVAEGGKGIPLTVSEGGTGIPLRSSAGRKGIPSDQQEGRALPSKRQQQGRASP